MKVLNPYKGDIRQQNLTHIQCDVGEDDWRRIWRIYPEHGFQDRFMSMLFKRFFELAQPELPNEYGLESEQALATLIKRLTLASAPRPGRHHYAGGRPPGSGETSGSAAHHSPSKEEGK